MELMKNEGFFITFGFFLPLAEVVELGSLNKPTNYIKLVLVKLTDSRQSDQVFTSE